MTAALVAGEAKRHLHTDFSRYVLFQKAENGSFTLLHASCKVLPGELEQLAASLGDRDAAMLNGLRLEGRRYEVYRHHPPLVFGRSVADCEPEVSTGIAVYRAEGSAAAGGQPCFIAATFEQPHTSAQAVPRLLDFAQRYLGRAVG